uniref:Uncharacterized protein n=1 Tax=uncultured prokaryote TaxID=198431 RepID=A0A0H5QNW6_9ZZZZ|nr:hypothetical protein [uncultured prokaryote]
MRKDQDDARDARNRAFHELRVYVTRSNYGQDRVVKIWHKPLGRDWRTQDFIWKSVYGPVGEYGGLMPLISAALSALEELDYKLDGGEL